MAKKARPLFDVGEITPEFYVEEPRLSLEGKCTPKIAELESGERVEYDYCLSEDNKFDGDYVDYLGKGRILSIGGVVQHDKNPETLCFWREKIKVSSDYQSVEDGILDGILNGRSIEHAKQRIWEASKNGSFDLEGAMQDFLEKSKDKS